MKIYYMLTKQKRKEKADSRTFRAGKGQDILVDKSNKKAVSLFEVMKEH